MVVVVETGFLQAENLVVFQHAQGHAGFHAQVLDALHHGFQHIHVAIFGGTPRRAHAIAGCAASLGFPGFCQHTLNFDQLGGRKLGAIARGLRTIGAIFGTAAGFDAEQLGTLHLIGIKVLSMHRLGAKQQIHKGKVVDGVCLFAGPVGAEFGGIV